MYCGPLEIHKPLQYLRCSSLTPGTDFSLVENTCMCAWGDQFGSNYLSLKWELQHSYTLGGCHMDQKALERVFECYINRWHYYYP